MRYVALFRGLNVGKSTRVPMADLRAMFENAGATAVKSYVQSGNVVFTATAQDVGGIVESVVAAMKRDLGVTTWVALRTAPEMASVIERNPFGTEAADPKTVHVAFYRDRVSPPLSNLVLAETGEAYRVSGAEIFVFVPNGLSKATFDPRFWTKDLAHSTMRNWRTVTTLAAMAAEDAGSCM